MSGNVLELRDVVVDYDGRTVLQVPHLALRRGEILTLLGPNGSGKTTLLRLLGLLVRPARGRVVFSEEDVDFGNPGHLLELRRRMAGVMQEPLLCRMSVQQNVGLGLRFRGVASSERSQRIESWLEKLSIAHLGDRPASKLSGGEAQRTSLARAMALHPEVLFLDEPFAALDAPTRQSLLQEFRAILAESRVTTLFATHDRGEALALGHRIAVLLDGKVAQVDSPDAVFSRPESVEVARFVGIETLIPGRVKEATDGMVEVDCGDLQLQAEKAPGSAESWSSGDHVCLAVRPEEIDLIDADLSPEGIHPNVLEGTVKRIVPGETHFRVEVDCGVSVVAVVSRARVREMAMEVGSSVRATFPGRAAHLIGTVGP
jgi:tungstate transport system ATP-binding protein